MKHWRGAMAMTTIETRPLAGRIAAGLLAVLLGMGCDDGAGVEAPASGGGSSAVEEQVPEQDRMVDDFEDGDQSFCLPEGEGYWRSASAAALAVNDGGADGTQRALRAKADLAGLNLVAELSAPDAAAPVDHDYSSCRALELWAKIETDSSVESHPVIVSLETRAGRSSSRIDVSRDWQRFTLPWSDFTGSLPVPEPSGAGGSGGAAGAAGLAGAWDAAAAGAGGEAQGGVAGGLASGSMADEALPSALLDPATIRRIRFEAAAPVVLAVDQIVLTACRILDLNPAIPEPPPLGSAGPEGSPVFRHGQLRVKGNQLLDQSGTPLQLKGVSSMWLNWESRAYAENLEALRWMRDNWNLNIIRAAMGVAAAGGYTSDRNAMVSKVQTIVENALELGVYVIVDWHDDDAVQRTAPAKAFFADLAARYGDRPNLIYETFNEPMKVSWSSVLKPYHQAVVATIRGIDPDNLIVLGTPQWSQLVDEASADPLRGSNLLYTLHFYSCTHTGWLRSKGDTALGRGVALFVTEWGATNADGGLDGLVCAEEANRWLDWMAEKSLSWAAWKLDTCNESSCLLGPSAPVGGGWTDAMLHGHGSLVRDAMKRP